MIVVVVVVDADGDAIFVDVNEAVIFVGGDVDAVFVVGDVDAVFVDVDDIFLVDAVYDPVDLFDGT